MGSAGSFALSMAPTYIAFLKALSIRPAQLYDCQILTADVLRAISHSSPISIGVCINGSYDNSIAVNQGILHSCRLKLNLLRRIIPQWLLSILSRP